MKVPARVTRQNQLTLPKVVRDQLDIVGGDVVVFQMDADGIWVVGRELRLEEVLGSIELPGPTSSDFGVEIEEATAKAMEKYHDDRHLAVPGSPEWFEDDDDASVGDNVAPALSQRSS